MSRLIEVINSGSSSIKYQLFDLADPDHPTVWASGLVEAIGEPGSRITHRTRIGQSADSDFRTETIEHPIPDHTAGMEAISEAFARTGAIETLGELAAFGHRVVHGGDSFAAPALVDDAVLEAIEACIPLAPLHNPANLAGILGARAAYPESRTWWSSTPRSTRPCRPTPTPTPSTPRSPEPTASAVMDSTAPRTPTSPAPRWSISGSIRRPPGDHAAPWQAAPAPARCRADAASTPRWV